MRTAGIALYILLAMSFITCAEKPGNVLQIVLELDAGKAVDVYLNEQARDLIREELRSEEVLCKSVERALETRGDNMLILRPYVPEGTITDTAQYMMDMKKKLVKLGVNEGNIKAASGGVPELTAWIDLKRNTKDLVGSLLGGSNPVIVHIIILRRFEGAGREDYIKKAKKTLDSLQDFGKPRLIMAEGSSVIFSIQLSQEGIKRLLEYSIDETIKVMRRRFENSGIRKFTVKRVPGMPRILIEGSEEQVDILKAFGNPGILEIKLVKPDPITGTGMWSGEPGTAEPSYDRIPLDAEVRRSTDGGWYVLDSEAGIDIRHLEKNSARAMRGGFGEPIVKIPLTVEGQRRFAKFTAEHVGEHVALLLDGVVLSTPRIAEKIVSKNVTLTGEFTKEETDHLAGVLNSGALRVPLKVVSKRTFAPVQN
jgi:hypothetical protein